MVKVFESGKTLSNDVIKLFESFLDINLPKSYKNFLQSHNGGRPKPGNFKFACSDGGSSIHYFYGIDADPDYDLVKDIKIYQSRIPKGFLPIAYDPGGNLICLVVKGPEREKIYFWDHEKEANYGEEPTYSNMTLIADNFDAFLESLHELEL